MASLRLPSTFDMRNELNRSSRDPSLGVCASFVLTNGLYMKDHTNVAAFELTDVLVFPGMLLSPVVSQWRRVTYREQKH